MPIKTATTIATPTNIEYKSPSLAIPVGFTPLKICLLGYRSAPYGGGQGIYIKYLSKALVEAGHQVDVISGQPYPHVDSRVTLIKMPGMNLFETGLNSIRLYHLKSLTNIIEWTGKLTGAFSEPRCFGRRVYKYLKKHGRGYDIIHDNQCLSWGTLKLQQQGFPLVTTIHHPITSDHSIALAAANTWTERVLINRWHSFLTMQKKVVKNLHNVVTVSKKSQEDISAAFGIQPQAINLIYNGIDIDEFRPLPNVQEKPFRVMATTSADAPLKGAKYLLTAVSLLKQRYSELELLLVGKLNAGGETEKLIRHLQLADNIHFVSDISTQELIHYYAQAQVVIVPSIYEGFGLPAGEAMACGKAVVSTVGGALPEVVGDAAIQVPVKNSQAIANAVSTLLDNKIVRKQLGKAGRKRIENLFCWKRVALQMTSYYLQVIDGRSKYY